MSEIVINTVIILLLSYSSIIDIKERKVSNKICLCIAVLSLINFSLVNLLGLLMAFIVLIIAIKTGQIGGGDVKLITALSLCLGFEGTMILLFFSTAVMLIFYIISKLIKGEKAAKMLPFVPFIATGYITTIILLS